MKFLCLLCIFCGSLAPSFCLDRTAFSFTKYDLNVRIEPDQERLAVRGKITVRNDSAAPQKDLSLQISSSLDWRSISLAGKPVEFVSKPYISDIDHTGALSEAIVVLPQEIPPHGVVEFDIGYEGVIPLDISRLTRLGVPENDARNTDWDQISKSFSAVRGLGYVAWYPVATEAASLSQENSVPETIGEWKQRTAQADMTVNFCLWKKIDSPVKVLMNDESAPGNEGNGGLGGDDMNCSQHVFSPLGQTVPMFALGGYETLKRPSINIAYFPQHKAAAENYALASDQALLFIARWFGTPRESAKLAELENAAFSPYESGDLLLTPLLDIDPKLAEIAAVHQLTHAAFPSPRSWIYEGLAHFAQALFRERQSDRATALHFMDDHLPAMVEAEKSLATEHSERSLINTGVEEMYRSKAMFVWWMLRDMLGDAVLQQSLALYRADQDTQPSYMQHLLEGQSKRDLTQFFDDWVYHDRGLPDFRITSVYSSRSEQGNYIVTVTVENLGSPGAEVPVTVEPGSVTGRLEVQGKSNNSIRIVVPSAPMQVIVNDGSVPESDMSNNAYIVQPTSKKP